MVSSKRSSPLPSRKFNPRDYLFRNAFRTAGSIGRCSPKDAIVISGAPRSGTTIVQEVLQHTPGYKTLNEPLLKKSIQNKYGFTSRSYVPKYDDAPQKLRFFKMVLNGQQEASARWSFRSASAIGQLREHASNRKLLVKFCRLNRMLPWFCHNFKTRGVVLVIRHPCSVVSSMLKYGQWDHIFPDRLKAADSPLALEALPESTQAIFTPIVDSIHSAEEALAAIWALDYYIPLLQEREHPWIILPYERLLRHGNEELSRINGSMGIKTTESMRARLRQPSSSVKGELSKNAMGQLAKWQRTLSPSQIDNILNIVSHSGLGKFYSHALEPDYDALNSYQSPYFRWT